MKDFIQQNEININGKVIETYFKEGRQFLKISVEPGFLEFVVNTNLDVHLGDELILTGNFKINRINQLNQNNFN
jgi:hypothetical protein